MAVIGLPKDTQQKWFALAERAGKKNLAASWAEELANRAVGGSLEERILEEFSMAEGAFAEYLDGLVERDMRAVAAEPDVTLDSLSTAEAEWVQAAQAPAELFAQWRVAREEERPLLMGQWISDGKVRWIKFAPGDLPENETPSYSWMRRGQSLLLEGRRRGGFALIRAAVMIDPVAAEGFSLWLGNSFVEESAKFATDPEILGFVRELYGPEHADLIREARING
jgi:hypothetical protein